MVKERPVAGRVYGLVERTNWLEGTGDVVISNGIYAGRTWRDISLKHFFYTRFEHQVFILYRFDKFKVFEGNIVIPSIKYAKRKVFDETGFFEDWFKRKGL